MLKVKRYKDLTIQQAQIVGNKLSLLDDPHAYFYLIDEAGLPVMMILKSKTYMLKDQGEKTDKEEF